MKFLGITLFLLGLTSITTVLGVKCYYGEVFDDVPEQIAQLEEKECKNELGNCIKYEGMSKRKEGWRYDCGSDGALEDQSNGCHYYKRWYGGSDSFNATVCYCTGDLCNAAISTQGLNISLMILSLIFSPILRFLL